MSLTLLMVTWLVTPGVLSAAIKAVETVDECLGRILLELNNVGGTALILADHGNCEQMINYENGTPHTSHTHMASTTFLSY